MRWVIAAMLGVAGCGDGGASDHDAGADASAATDAPSPDATAHDAAPCPADMALVGAACMDLYEAPNRSDALPLVMYSFDEAAAWCDARGKRLCFEDEWLLACEGPTGTAYPYGAMREAGRCNDDKVWRAYNQSLLSGWPSSAAATDIDSLEELLARARATGATGTASANHVESLYQGETPAESPGCVGSHGVYDLVGNVEEWTRRRQSTDPLFEGNLRGRYWAEARTCQSGVTTHADPFRFYEIGFRCCADPI